jgi:DNA-binding transcriptional MerR regulator
VPPSEPVGSLLFTADQVCRITGLSQGQLRYWDKTGFFSPEYTDDNVRPFSRIYSFRDVVGLYTIGLLRKRHGFPLQQLRTVGDFLHQHHDAPWSGLALFVVGQDIAFQAPSMPLTSARDMPGQGFLVTDLRLEKVARHVEGKAKRLRRRRPNQIGKIDRNRYILHNASVVAGTRISTAAVWNFHTAGYDEDAIIREYPRLKRDDIKAAIVHERKQHAMK